MQAIEIFKVGTHTAMSGQTLGFDRNMLAAAVAAYDPNTHEAPIVVGHPKDNHPAFGWIDHLELTDDGVLLAHPKQVDADFAELVKQGKYKKVSASFYTADSENNPKQGALYLRHVGFLGAQPPAIKGLKDVQFSEGDGGVVAFADVTDLSSGAWAWRNIADIFRSLREYFIAEKGMDAADKMLPTYAIDQVAGEANRKREVSNSLSNPPFPYPSFSEEQTMSQTTENAAPATTATTTAQTVDFSEREAALLQRERELSKRELALQVDDLIGQGRVLPAHKANLVEFMAHLDDSQTLEFSEGGDGAAKTVKQSPRVFMQQFLASLPVAVDFAERSADMGAKTGSDLTAQELAAKAQAYHAKQHAKGQHISFSEAVQAVTDGQE